MVTLKRGDCLELMAQIPDKSIDLILCDLPYGVTRCKWDSVIPFNELWLHYNRISKDNSAVVLTASQPFTTALISSNIEHFRYALVWDKGRSSNGMNAHKMPLKTHEDICVFYRKQPTYNPQMWESDTYVDKSKWDVGRSITQNVVGGGVKKSHRVGGKSRFPVSILSVKQDWRRQDQIHPTQKPVALMEYLIKTYTDEGDTVLDNCMGSGTTGVACANTNRKFIGMELDSDYFRIARRRVSEAYKTKAP